MVEFVMIYLSGWRWIRRFIGGEWHLVGVESIGKPMWYQPPERCLLGLDAPGLGFVCGVRQTERWPETPRTRYVIAESNPGGGA